MGTRIGFYGGTFDPPHMGHTAAAAAFAAAVRPDRLYIIPNYLPPLKDGRVPAPAADRLAMAALAFPGCTVCDFELKSGGVSYTYKTAEYLHRLHPDGALFMLIGHRPAFTAGPLAEPCRAAAGGQCLRGAAAQRGGRARGSEGRGAASGFRRSRALHPLRAGGGQFHRGAGGAACGADASAAGRRRGGLYTRKGALPMNEREIWIAGLHLSDRRLTHTFGVEKAALAIAARHFPALSEAEVSAAALLHDWTKELTEREQLDLCADLGIELGPQERRCIKVLHGWTAAALAKREYGLPPAVCDAIRWHSTLRAGCAPLDAVLFLADFIEENRRSLACVRCREYYEGLWRCGDTDALEKALVFGLDAVIRENLEEGNLILKDTLESRNAILYTLLQKADGQA